ncbi:MAG: barstar family protein [Bacteroidota bacterium]
MEYEPLESNTSSGSVGVAQSALVENYWKYSDKKCVVIKLDCCMMKTKEGLFNQFAQAFKFPEYFGENWSAFNDCVTDLGWITADAYSVLLLNSEFILADESSDQFDIFIRIISEAADEWSKPVAENDRWDRLAIPFHIIFQASGENTTHFAERLERLEALFE